MSQIKDIEADDNTNKRPWWLKASRVMPNFKPNKTLKRWRKNARIRKLVQPKPAVVVLQDVFGNCQFSYFEPEGSKSEFKCLVKVDVCESTFTAIDTTKLKAKEKAAEKALKSLMLEKMTSIAEKYEQIINTQSVPSNAESTSGNSTEKKKKSSARRHDPIENVLPWGSLANFAMYKLFSEWHEQSNDLPESSVATLGNLNPKVHIPEPMKKLPDNPESYNPVMLLNQLKPSAQYDISTRKLSLKEENYIIKITVDGSYYYGEARSKKLAKREAAKAALTSLYGVKYDIGENDLQCSVTIS